MAFAVAVAAGTAGAQAVTHRRDVVRLLGAGDGRRPGEGCPV